MFCAPKDQDLMMFGKHKGRTYQSVLDEDVDYVKWILEHCSEQSCSGMRRFKDWLLAKAAAGLIARACRRIQAGRRYRHSLIISRTVNRAAVVKEGCHTRTITEG